MARRSQHSIRKRQREARKREKTIVKRERKEERKRLGSESARDEFGELINPPPSDQEYQEDAESPAEVADTDGTEVSPEEKPVEQ